MRPLVSAAPLIMGFTGDPLGYPDVLCHGDTDVLDLYVCLLHMLQQFIDSDDVGLEQHTVLVLGLDNS